MTLEPHGEVTPLHAVRRNPGLRRVLIAAARRITEGKRPVKRPGTGGGWEDDAWAMYDLVGELQFIANTLASRMAQAHLFVARIPDDPTQDPIPVDLTPPEGKEEPTETDRLAVESWEAMFTSPVQRGQMIARLGVGLFIPGRGYVVGIPPHLLPENRTQAGLTPDPTQEINPQGTTTDVNISDLRWFALSSTEVTEKATDGEMTLRLGADTITCNPRDVFLIDVWRPHPQNYGQADSPTRANLAILREIVGLTMHISAQIDSRLAGAGILFIDDRLLGNIPERDPDGAGGEDDGDPVTDALMEGMITPIGDRSNASAVVPLTFTASGLPDGTRIKDLVHHLSFATPFDAETADLRTTTLTRLANGLDAPPELLTGVGGMNHWGAWLVKEETVTAHVAPPLDLICDAFTTQYLWPLLDQQNVPEEEAHRYIIWRDVAHLVERPDKSDDALKVHAVGALSDAALRDATGFGDVDAPAGDPALQVALELVKAAPQLLAAPGLPAVVEQVRAVLDAAASDDIDGGDGDTGEAGTPVGPPSGPASSPPALAASTTEAFATAFPPSTTAPPVTLSVTVPEGAIQVTTPPAEVTVNVPTQDPPNVAVNIPQGPAPVVVVDTAPPPDVHVHVPPGPAPQVTVEAPNVEVTVPVPEVTVEAPQVTVEAPTVEVTAEVASPNIDVHVPTPEVTVNVPKPERRHVSRKVIRDQQGKITGVEGDDYS